MENVTVEEAIKAGRRQLFIVPAILVFVLLFVCVAGSLLLDAGVEAFVVTCIVVALGSPFLYYFMRLPKWRIWAFSNVRNVHELKQQAILRQIYPKDGSFLWRFEIKSAEQKRIIEALNDKFKTPDVFEEDYSLPYETAYAYSKLDKVLPWVFAICGTIGAIIWLPQKEYLGGGIMAVSAVIFGFVGYKRYNNQAPLLIISNEGITTKKHGFHSWQEIKNEKVFLVREGKHIHYEMSFETGGQTLTISLRELAGLKGYKVDQVLRAYRGRYQSNLRVKV